MEFKDTKKTKKIKKEEVKRSKRNEKLHENLGFQDEVTGSGLTLPLKQINNNNKKTYETMVFKTLAIRLQKTVISGRLVHSIT